MVLTTGLVMTGCGSDSDSESSSAPPTPTGGCATDPATGLTQATSIPIPSATLSRTSPGAEPLRTATVAPDTKVPQKVSLSTTSSEVSTTAETTQSVTTPLTARFGCSATDELNLVFGTPTSPQSELSDQLKAATGSIAGITFGPALSPLSLRLRPTDAASAPARRALEQSIVQSLQNSLVLPTEPIGVGATWHSERTIAGAATVVQTIEARLTRWEGSRLTISFTSDETPVNSVFTIPGGNATLTIDRYTYTGSGEITIDLTRGLPVGGDASYTGARELAGADPGRPLVQRIGFAMSWK
ncbi:hypothetical protein ACPXB3_06435 [Gordonia sp. DT219]|uniref:hypothetical protein n=1 Tax=Gordonia sp. DT219 TaxID=3416658 RepID=UPI003CEB8F78